MKCLIWNLKDVAKALLNFNQSSQLKLTAMDNSLDKITLIIEGCQLSIAVRLQPTANYLEIDKIGN